MTDNKQCCGTCYYRLHVAGDMVCMAKDAELFWHNTMYKDGAGCEYWRAKE